MYTSRFLTLFGLVLAAAFARGQTLSGLTVAPTSVVSGNPSTGTIKLTGNAPAGGVSVVVRSNASFAQVVSPVVVAAGLNTASFPITTSYVYPASTATITASAGGKAYSASLLVTPGNGLSSGPWPKFMADARNSGQAKGAGAKGNLKWTVDFHGGTYGTPVLGATTFAVWSYYVTDTAGLVSGIDIFKDDGTFVASALGTQSTYVNGQPVVGPDGTYYTTILNGGLVALNPDATVKWTYAAGNGTPVFANGVEYEETDNSFVSLDPSGNVQWTVNGYALAAATKGTIYAQPFLEQNGCVTAFSLDGQVKWKWNAPQYFGVPGVAPDGSVYLASTGDQVPPFLRAVSSEGVLKWTYKPSAAIGQSTVGPDGTIYLYTKDGKVSAILPTGRLKWVCPLLPTVPPGPPLSVGPDGSVYASWGSTVYAIGPSGVSKWNYSFPYPQFPGAAPPNASLPAVAADGSVWVSFSINWGQGELPNPNPNPGVQSARVVRFASDGQILSQFAEGGGAMAPSIGSDGTLYLGCASGALRAIHPDGTPAWTFVAGGPINSTPTLGADGTVYFGCADGNLYALSPAGAKKWTCKMGGAIDGAPAIGGASGLIYVVSDDGAVDAVDLTGHLKWTYKMGVTPPAITPALADDGTIYITDFTPMSGTNLTPVLLALTPTGALKWPCTTIGTTPSISVCVAADGNIYVPAVDAFSPSGAHLWHYPPPNSWKVGGYLSSSGATLYGEYPSSIVALTEQDTWSWTFTDNFVGATSLYEPVDGAGIVYAALDTTLVAVQPSGFELWSTIWPSEGMDALSIGADGTLYVTSLGGFLYAVD